jgi:ubiquinone/menaquinone biosynthesis C-methylase UbiE
MGALINLQQNAQELFLAAKKRAEGQEWVGALPLAEKAYELKPGSPESAFLLFDCLLGVGNIEKAEEQLLQLESLKLSETLAQQLIFSKMVLSYRQKKYSEAYDFSLALKSGRDHRFTRDVINECLQKIYPCSYSDVVEMDIIKLFSEERFDSGRAQFLASTAIIQKYLKKKLDFTTLSNDQLLLTYLKDEHCRGAKMEGFLTAARKSILTNSLINMNVPDEWVPLINAIAWQNWHNEYVHYVSREEDELLESLLQILGQQVGVNDFSPEQIEGLILLMLMYRPLGELAIASRLKEFPVQSWPASVADLIKQTLFEISEELEYAEAVPSLGSISNEVSQKVRAQYEEHPYPRWKRCLNSNSKSGYVSTVAYNLLLEDDESFAGLEVKDILVAGCGTGKQPINLALNIDASITAIDITKRSLGYASMMADKLGVKNIDFYHMDLMDVELLGKQFDAVECGGVLHHMDDPEAGLRALLKVVKPGGFLKLGLYSEKARESIVEVRKAFVQSGMKPDLDNIRAVRSALLSPEAKPSCKKVTTFGDFFATSPCRDLLFHAQEHRFTIQKLKTMFEKYNLEFLGMVFGQRHIAELFEQQNGSGSINDLDKWEAYENDQPTIFANMYQFFVRVPGGGDSEQ